MSDDQQQPQDPRRESQDGPTHPEEDTEGGTEHTQPIWRQDVDGDRSEVGRGDRHEHESDSVAPRSAPVMPPAAEENQTSWFPAAVGKERRHHRPGRRGIASLAVLSLLLGIGGGVAGAALYQSLDDDGAATSETPAYTSTARDTGDEGSDQATRSGVDDSQAPKEGSVESVATSTLPSVVQIDVVSAGGSARGGTPQGGSGSGIILSSDGQILTNNHVVELAQDGGEVSVSFNDGSAAQAEVLGTDALTDTALIQAKGVSGLRPATIGKSGKLSVGQDVVAVGSPFGLDSTVTTGIVSALNRPVSVGSDQDGNSTTYPAIQTDAAINPGNSGGPLVDLGGRVVGINSSIRTAGGGLGGEAGSIGLGFAIPIDEVLPIVDQMAAGEEPTHARLGVSVGDVSLAGLPDYGFEGNTEDLPRVGALVREVPGGGAAADAGLETGDVITKVDDTLITGSNSLVATIRSYRPGDEITVTWVRDGTKQSATLELGNDTDIAGG